MIASLVFTACQKESSNGDLYATLPFRPGVIFESHRVTVTNTENDPYQDTRLNIYVGWTIYSAKIGMLSPGETVSRSFSEFINEKDEPFDPSVKKASHLEVRAQFRGNNDHKDFPPPE